MNSQPVPPLTIVYQNVNRQPVIPLIEGAVDNGAQLLLIAEPPKFLPSKCESALSTFRLETRGLNVTKIHRPGERTALLQLSDSLITQTICDKDLVKAFELINYSIKIYVVYLSPTLTTEQCVRLMRNILSKVKHRAIICMDSNAHLSYLDSDIVTPSNQTRRGDALLKLFYLYNWVLMNRPNQKTFYSRDSVRRATVIDWILATPDIARITNFTIGSCSTSDHSQVVIHLDLRSDNDICHIPGKRVFIDCSSFINHITRSNPLDPLTFSDQISSALSRSTRKCRFNVTPPYWNDTLSQMRSRIKKLNRCKPTTRLLHTDIRKENCNYARLREVYRTKYLRKKFCTMSLAQLQKHMSQISRNCPMNAPIIYDSSGGRITDPSEIGQAVLSHFYPLSEPQVDYTEYKASAHDGPSLSFHEIKLQVNKLKNCSPGEDRLNSHVMKKWNDRCPQQIRDLMNSWLKMGIYPSAYKTCKITVIPKDSSKPFLISNLRPIGLTCTPGKVYELVLAERLLYYISGLFHPSQHAYLPGRTQEALLLRLDAIRRINFRRHRTEVISTLDIAGAFNNVQHKAILDSLRLKSCPSYMLTIIADYLSERLNKITIAKGSATRPMYKGVPQGSTLGPLLFVTALDLALKAFLNNTPSGFTFDTLVFADDLTLIYSFDSTTRSSMIQKHIRQTEARLSDALLTIGLELSPVKTKYLVTLNPFAATTLLKSSLNATDDLVILGLTFSSNLSYMSHITDVAEKAVKQANSYSSYLSGHNCLPMATKRQLLNTQIYPIITYAASVWLNGLESDQAEILTYLRSTHLRIVRILFSTFKTLPFLASLVIPGSLPLHLSALKKSIKQNSLQTGFYYHLDKSIKINQQLNSATLPHPSVRFTIKTYTYLDLSESQLLLHRYSIYTDGALSASSASCSYLIYDRLEKQVVKMSMSPLPTYVSSTQCELQAIIMALEYTANWVTETNFLLLTDSLSTLKHLEKLKCLDPDVDKLKRLVCSAATERNNFYTFAWIRSKTGLNLLADSLCKIATLYRAPTLPITVSQVDSLITHRLREFLANEYLQTPTTGCLRSFIPTLSTSSHKHAYFNRSTIQLYTGHGPFASYKHKINAMSTPKCWCGGIQDPIHVIFQCPLFKQLISKACSKLSLQIPDINSDAFTNFLSSKSCHQLIKRVAPSLIREIYSVDRNELQCIHDTYKDLNYEHSYALIHRSSTLFSSETRGSKRRNHSRDENDA